jgi:hypothetical protein
MSAKFYGERDGGKFEGGVQEKEKRTSRRLYQRRQRPQRLAFLEKRMLQQADRVRPLLGVDLETLGEVVSELARERLGLIDLWRAVCSDEVKGSEGVLVKIGGFAFDHFCVMTTPKRRSEKSG